MHQSAMVKNLVLTAAIFAGTALASSAAVQQTTSTTPTHGASAVSGARRVSPYRATSVQTHARNFYLLNWGIDPVGVKQVSSGTMVQFSYRVFDAKKAETLNDKKNSPYLVDPQARVRLVVPTMEKVGQLRQTANPEKGKIYWMVFSNKGGHVKHGDHVNVVIGNFHVDGLVVE
jgi:hypothetical protein